jgi:hypothetical protein
MENNNYDSTLDTLAHIRRVQELITQACGELIHRGIVHDKSKLEAPEKIAFDIATPKLKSLRFGTPEYHQSLDDLKDALDHHYQNNTHHPQHYSNGVTGMDLFDLLEMLIDWKAASERHEESNIIESIRINTTRFDIGDQLAMILYNTARRFFELHMWELEELKKHYRKKSPNPPIAGTDEGK